ncbi:MAG: DNA methyltransferase [Candidatus Hodarchaeales archaeon]
MPLEKDFPIAKIQKIAKVESQRRQFYRPIYSVHKSWARRPGSTFRAVGIAQFSEAPLFSSTDDDKGAFYKNHNFSDRIVLDPFCGGGTTIIELNRLGVKTVGIDLNPVAWFTTKKELDILDTAKFQDHISKFFSKVGKQIIEFYQTKCTECGSDQADIMYTFWVRTIRCPSCQSQQDLFKYYIIGKKQRKSSETMVICPDCDMLFYSSEDLSSTSVCPSCDTKFIPKIGNCRKKIFSCTRCESEFRLVDILQDNLKSFSSRQIAIEFYCKTCKYRGYKQIEDKDIRNYNTVQGLFEEQKEGLPYPREHLPIRGPNIKNLINYGFQDFADLFNSRQLLSLSLLLECILSISDQNLKEFFVSAFSSCLEFHTVLCPYNYTMKQIVNIFNFQSFLVPLQYVENNVWGTDKGNGTFITYLDKIIKAKEYCDAPFEIDIKENQISRVSVPGDRIHANIVNDFEQLVTSKNPDALLITGSSINLKKYNIPDQSIDLVLTDPPYFDYIQYSELANFFYIWLRVVLKLTYPWFESPTIMDKEEIGIQKNKNQFVSQLIKVFTECHRVLKDNSPLVFTFHHSNTNAWILILTALKESQFLLKEAYPVISEFQARPVTGSNTDIILVARKTTDDETNPAENISGSLEEEINVEIQAYSNNLGTRRDGEWEKFLAKILPSLSLRLLYGTENALKTTLGEVFRMKK